MTSQLIEIKHRCPRVWRAVERVNGWLFGLRCPHFEREVNEVLSRQTMSGFDFSAVTEEDLEALSEFLGRQPQERLVHFDPHGFDVGTLRRLHRNRAFAMMKITSQADNSIAGYFFLRCFFVGRAFHGLLVDGRYGGRGLGTAMWSLSSQICRNSGLRMLATVAKSNEASLSSARRGTEVTVVEELEGGYLLIECKPRTARSKR